MTLSDTSWAPLREAVPSFEERWAEITSMSWYDPTLEGLNTEAFAAHLAERAARADWTEYPAFCAALERLYAELSSEDAEFLLTAGVLDDLITAVEKLHLDLFPFYKPLGPQSREGWRVAYAHTHGGRDYVARPVA